MSVVVSNWNRLDDIQNCIGSILMQEYPNVEVIVVDNCSTDGSLEYLRSMKDSIKLYEMPHSDFSAMYTLNHGFYQARGKYVFVVDNDCFFCKTDVISEAVKVMESDEKIFAMSTNVLGRDWLPQMVLVKGDRSRLLKHLEVATCGVVDSLEFHGAATIMRNDVGSKLGWYDLNFFIYSNELELSIRAWNAGYRVVYNSDIDTMHVGSTAWRPEMRNRYHGFKNIMFIINKYFRKNTRIKLYLLCGFVYTFRMATAMLYLKEIDMRYLIRWIGILARYGIYILTPMDRQISSDWVHHKFADRLWLSYKLVILSKFLNMDVREYGIQR